CALGSGSCNWELARNSGKVTRLFEVTPKGEDPGDQTNCFGLLWSSVESFVSGTSPRSHGRLAPGLRIRLPAKDGTELVTNTRHLGVYLCAPKAHRFQPLAI